MYKQIEEEITNLASLFKFFPLKKLQEIMDLSSNIIEFIILGVIQIIALG